MSDLEQLSIEELLTNELGEIESVPPIEKEEQVETYLRLIASRLKEIERLKKLRDNEVLKIMETTDQKIKRIQDNIDFFGSQLHNYLLSMHNRNQKIRSLDFINGKLRFRKMPDTIKIAEGFAPEDDLANPHVKAKTVYSIDKQGLLKLAKSGGELPEWAIFQTGEDKFEMEVNINDGTKKL